MTKNVKVEVRLSRVSSPTTNGVMRLTVIDRLSRTQIVELDLDEEQFFRLIGNMDARVVAEVPDDERWPRVGKKYEWEKVRGEEFDALAETIRFGVREPTEEMLQFGEKAQGDSWDGFRWTLHNYGWDLGVFRWVDVAEE